MSGSSPGAKTAALFYCERIDFTTLAPVDDRHTQRLTRLERAQAGALDSADVNEDILRLARNCNKAKAFGRIEPLNRRRKIR